jgi:hypothetical protein
MQGEACLQEHSLHRNQLRFIIIIVDCKAWAVQLEARTPAHQALDPVLASKPDQISCVAQT